MKNILLLTAFIASQQLAAQSNLTITPENPAAGQPVRFAYTPDGGSKKNPEIFVLKLGSGSAELVDIPLKKEGSAYKGIITPDTSVNLLVLGIQQDDKTDNNNEEGYFVRFFDGDKEKKGTNLSLARFYEGYSDWKFDISGNPEKALGFYEKEISLYPEQKTAILSNYLSALNRADKTKAGAAIQSEIESMLQTGLKTKDDYTKIAGLYTLLKLPQQQRFFAELAKEKFPYTRPTAREYYDRFIKDSTGVGKEVILKQVSGAIVSEKDPAALKSLKSTLQSSLLNFYIGKKDWLQLQRVARSVADPSVKMRAYNSAAWKLQEDSVDLPLAASLSAQTVAFAKAELKSPTQPKPKMMLNSEWLQSRKNAVATYADTYAMVLYKSGNYKKGIQYAKEAALTYRKGEDAETNTTYALLAEKALTPNRYTGQLEQFVRKGSASGTVKEVLKRAYIKSNKSDSGFDDYMAQLEKGAKLKIAEELKTKMIDQPTPQFTLADLSGNNVSIAALKNKVVIVDFWATWCGPCKASFPAMQHMVNKYKDDPDVKFLFVNTWENAEDKKKNAADFISSMKYNFHVLLDNDSKIVEQFKVSGIPTKFVIGKDGNIKFQSVGFEGDARLQDELEVMIEMAK